MVENIRAQEGPQFPFSTFLQEAFYFLIQYFFKSQQCFFRDCIILSTPAKRKWDEAVNSNHHYYFYGIFASQPSQLKTTDRPKVRLSDSCRSAIFSWMENMSLQNVHP